MNVGRLDLNLLQILHAVLAEQSVTRAARRLSMTQPAVSNALNRARALLGDPLVVRLPGGIRPTARAEALWPELDAAMAALHGLAQRQAFAPDRCDLTLTVAITDALSDRLAAVATRFARAAPRARLHLRPHTNAASLGNLERGALDCAVGMFPQVPAGLHAAVLGGGDYVCVLRSGHALADRLTLDGFLGARHVLALPSGRSQGLVDEWLGALGHRRDIGVVVNRFAEALPIVRDTELLAAVPRRIAVHAALPGTVLRELPFPAERIVYKLLWHDRTDRMAPQRWFRDLLRQCLGGSDILA